VPAVWNVPPPVAHFVGRDELIAEVGRGLSASGAVSVVAVEGLGGVGKTALALEYCHRHAAEFDVVWWVSAESAAVAAEHLSALGEALGLAAGAEPGAVLARLRRHARWLLVFDNAEDPAALAPLRPGPGGGRVLVTSRRTGWGGLGQVLEVPTLARPESVALLAARLPGIDGQVADRIAELLGDLALALGQAAGFLDQTRTPPGQFAGWLETRLGEVAGLGEVPDRPGVTVATLWALSVERLAAASPAAVELLEVLALGGADPVPLDLFTVDAGLLGGGELAEAAADSLAFAQVVGALVAYSLARREGDAVSVHRLVQATTRHRLTAAQQEAHTATLLRLLRAGLPGDIVRNPQAWPRWRVLLPHARAVLDCGADSTGDDLAWLYNRTATYLQEHGQPGAARPLYERALAIDEAAYGPDHPTVAIDLNLLATALHGLGQPGAARPLLERALAIDEAAYGPDHPTVAAALDNLANVLHALGQPAAARPLLERALAIDEAAYGPDHPTVATRLNNLANVLPDLGQPGAARPLLERALAIDEAAYGPDHPEVAIDLNNLGNVLSVLGQPGAARPLWARALAITAAAYGPDHPTVAAALNGLATALHGLGQPGAARPLWERALTITAVAFGPGHPTVAIIRDNLHRSGGGDD
jgi:tetratricopeptide (TPR) repeat protein